MSRAACRKSRYARKSPKGVSGNTVEGFDAADGDFGRSPKGRADFGHMVRRRALDSHPLAPVLTVVHRRWTERRRRQQLRPASPAPQLLPFAPKTAASRP
jgi:hypothetical protein